VVTSPSTDGPALVVSSLESGSEGGGAVVSSPRTLEKTRAKGKKGDKTKQPLAVITAIDSTVGPAGSVESSSVKTGSEGGGAVVSSPKTPEKAKAKGKKGAKGKQALTPSPAVAVVVTVNESPSLANVSTPSSPPSVPASGPPVTLDSGVEEGLGVINTSDAGSPAGGGVVTPVSGDVKNAPASVPLVSSDGGVEPATGEGAAVEPSAGTHEPPRTVSRLRGDPAGGRRGWWTGRQSRQPSPSLMMSPR
jgi:hypothetical protein